MRWMLGVLTSNEWEMEDSFRRIGWPFSKEKYSLVELVEGEMADSRSTFDGDGTRLVDSEPDFRRE